MAEPLWISSVGVLPRFPKGEWDANAPHICRYAAASTNIPRHSCTQRLLHSAGWRDDFKKSLFQSLFVQCACLKTSKDGQKIMPQSILVVRKSRFFYALSDRIKPLLWDFFESNIRAVQVINSILCLFANRNFPHFCIGCPIYIAPARLSIRRTAFDISASHRPSLRFRMFSPRLAIQSLLLTPYWPLITWNLNL